MTMSSGLSRLARDSTVVSVASPAGTIIHRARGLFNRPINSSMEPAPTAPSAASRCTGSGFTSNTTQWWPPRINRRTILAPILPSPIIPNCIGRPPSFLFHRALPAAERRDQRLGLARPPGARLVFRDRRRRRQHRVHHPPRGLDAVLPREERRIADHGIADQPFVGSHLVALLVADEEFRLTPDHLFSRHLGARSDGHRHPIGAEPEPDIIALRLQR